MIAKEEALANGMSLVTEGISLDVLIFPRGECSCGAVITGKLEKCWKCNAKLIYAPDKADVAKVKRILGNYRPGGLV